MQTVPSVSFASQTFWPSAPNAIQETLNHISPSFDPPKKTKPLPHSALALVSLISIYIPEPRHSHHFLLMPSDGTLHVSYCIDIFNSLILANLVGTGTAIAAAASGLVFGHPNDSDTSTGRRVLHKRNASIEPSPTRHDRLSSPSLSRPGTSYRDQAMSTADDPNHSTLPRPASRSRPPLSRYQRPQSSQFPSRRSSIKNFTLGNEVDIGITQPVDSRRNSLSSTGSWMRRLSLRPLSQHGSSPRSSIIADRQSVALSHSSTVPMLRPNTAAPNLAPNKLVKRSPSIPNHDPQQVSRSRSKGHLPTLRRPATSHQRTATLQQLRLNAQETQGSPGIDGPKYSFENRPSTESIQTASFMTSSPVLVENIGWSSFFHSRRTAVDTDGRPSTASPHSRANTVRRISAKAAMAYQNSVHLVKPRMVNSTSLPTLRHGPSIRLADPAEIVPEQHEPEERGEQKQQEQHSTLLEKQIESTQANRGPDDRRSRR
ncbi:hypothetical protein NQ176_g5553 [Zarea fungicola]|uniref:Uncharacterized protein n=1 Tax=Zarea fungicola TaxID=93591 RepID=A0ACC1N9U0_9HYPO|nr:hypothetical protein NQ176_g5553 [Lecanicillium fungicola]